MVAFLMAAAVNVPLGTSFVKKKKTPKKVASDSPRPVDFVIGELGNFVLNLPGGQVKFVGGFKLQKNCNQSCSSKKKSEKKNWAS